MADIAAPAQPQPGGLPLAEPSLTYSQLHELACIVCDRTDGPLRPAGYRTLNRLTWAVVICSDHEPDEASRRTELMAAADRRTEFQLCVLYDYVQRAWFIEGLGSRDPRRFALFTEAHDERNRMHAAVTRARRQSGAEVACSWGTPRRFR